ncbi:MAG: hypothetical protein SO164_03155 [Campylobacter sp.]|nr:hypothetical protein [Campylobacter sp.]
MKLLIYLNELRAGEGKKALLAKFLLAFLQTENKPQYVICVNEDLRLRARQITL